MRTWLLLALLCGLSVFVIAPAQAADDLTEQQVLDTIQSAKKALLAQQRGDGSWDCKLPLQGMEVGGTALVTLSLLNAGMTPDDKEIKQALKYLREADDPTFTYASSLVLMVLSIVKDPRDKLKMTRLVDHLEKGQITRGDMAGCWGYNSGGLIDLGGGDRSNGQFAVLGLYEAAHAGIPVKREVWERARTHWQKTQCGDGGWDYSGNGAAGGSTGSMTVAGIASLVMTSAMLQEDKDVDAQGNPNCCGKREPDEPMIRALSWLKSHFATGSNPGAGSQWLLYYLYGLERAGRLSGQRFFGDHDWYREGARFLIIQQDKRLGMWVGKNNEQDPVIGTSLALLFLSKGLAPVLINKLQYDSTEQDGWNRHQYEIRNLTDRISGAPRWPKLVTWQVVDMKQITKQGGVADLRQAPVLYLCGSEAPKFSDEDIELLKQYVNVGGFIFAVNTCQSNNFKDGCVDLVRRMYPKGESSLERLKPDHPIFRSEYYVEGDTVELWGADLGCRTAIVYAPEDLACFWSKWSRLDPPNRPVALRTRVERAMKVGVNVIAYATGREPPSKLRQMELASEEGQADNVQRGLLQVAQLRHSGGWDTAPKAARNLMLALNRTAGLTASTKLGAVTPADPGLFNYSLLTMHGRYRFEMSDAELDRLRSYLARGNVLFADACCGAPQFDAAFRKFAEQLYPTHKLVRIPTDHELFTARVGYDIKKVRRRAAEVAGSNQTLEANIIEGEPFLEGIEVDGRYVVIYSKHDISCALERQATLACAGYLPEDATKIAINIVQYSLLQDLK